MTIRDLARQVERDEFGPDRVNAPVREWQMVATFRGTQAQADELKTVLETAAAVYFAPTEENASALFTMGAEAVFTAAQLAREQSK